MFASSNHVTGFYTQREVISPLDPPRPDGLYGLSKAFGENVDREYERNIERYNFLRWAGGALAATFVAHFANWFGSPAAPFYIGAIACVVAAVILSLGALVVLALALIRLLGL